MGTFEPSATRQSGVPLSVKLILTTTILLVVAVGAASYSGLRTINALAEQEAVARRTSGEAAMERQSELMARNAANSAALPLAEGNFTYLDSLVVATVKEDPRITWMLIADAGSNRIVARTPGAPAGTTLADDLNVTVLAAPPTKAVSRRDPTDPTRFTFGIKIAVGERVVGQLRLGVSTSELEGELARSIAAARARARGSAREVLLVAGAILILGILLGAHQGLRMARPLHALSRQAHRIAEGDLHERVEVSSGDEIGQLGDDFNFMADRIGELLAKTASRASLEAEMSLARVVQESMVPSREMMAHGPFHVIGYCEPATTCGGDWWTLRKLSGDRLLLAVGDVTGHGIPSAMVAATARGAVEALAKVDERLLTPKQILLAIDSAIRGLGTEQLLMTCFVALIDGRRGIVEYSNAGHNFPYLLHLDEERAVQNMSVLALRGSPLGSRVSDLSIEPEQRRLVPGDVFVFYTDGVIDRVDAMGKRFGNRRLRGLLSRRTLAGDGEGLAALQDEILNRMAAFGGGAPLDDDVTLVLCEYDPPVRTAEQPVRRQALG